MQITASEALREAHEYSSKSSTQELASFLLSSIGPRYTAVGLGLSDARQIKAWRDGLGSPRENSVEQRLHLLASVTRAISRVYSSDTAAAFLYSANPDLNDRPPVLVIGEEEPLRTQSDVLRAVRAFLEA